MPERPTYFYMANLWSEVEKIFVYKESGEKEAVQSALARARSIIDKIKSFNNQSATFEVSILEGVLVDISNSDIENEISRAQLSSYLNPFALRMRVG